MAEAPADHQRPPKERYLVLGSRTNLLGRALKNLDKLLALDAKGQLTAKNVIKTCFPDMVAAKKTGNYDLKALTEFFDSIDEALCTDADEGGYSDISGPLALLMEATGCTLREGAEAIRNGKTIPVPQYVSPGQMELGEFATLQGGRNLIGGDLCRPGNYSIVDGQEDILPIHGGFGFNFPGEERFITNASQDGRANIQKVGDKVEALCGRVHTKQACSVMMMLSQSGLGPINRGLRPYGVESSEHSAVDYTLSKNAETGAVTIRYSSPAELPFRFEWTATVDVNGKVTSTPLTFEKPVEMTIGLAGKFVDDAARATGAKLTTSQRQYAVALLAQSGTNMYEKNARILARFTVNLALTDASVEGDRKRVRDMANSIRNWRDFGFYEGGMGQLNAALKTQANVILAENIADAGKFPADEPDIYGMMKVDANRNTFFVNGKQIVSKSEDHGAPLIAALKQALPSSKARKAVSCLLNQETVRLVGYPQNSIAYPAGPGQAQDVDVSKLPGAGKLANRNLAGGLYDQMLSGKNDAIYSLEVSKDGKTATITTTYPSTLAMGAGPDSTKQFGAFTVQTRLTLDLSADEPTITDARFSQTIE